MKEKNFEKEPRKFLLGVNEFVRRQTKNSRFSYYAGSWDQLVSLVKKNFNQAKKITRQNELPGGLINLIRA